MFKKVLDYAGEYRRLTYRSVAVLLLGVTMSVLPFWFAYQLILPLLGYGALEPAGAICRVAAIAVCGILYALLYVRGLALSHQAAYHTLENIRVSLQKKLEAQPLGTIQEKGVGVLKKMFIDDIESIELLLAHAIPEGISNVAVPVIVYIAMFFADWKLALLTLCSLPLGFVAMGAMYKQGASKMGAYYGAAQKMNSTIVEYINGMEVVKVFNRDGDSYKRFETDVKNYRDFTLDWYRVCWPWMALYNSIIPCTAMFTLPLGAWFVLQGWSTLPDLVLVLCMSFGVGAPLLRSLSFLSTMPQVNFKIEALEQLMSAPPLQQTDRPFAGKNHSISFEDVRFGYQEEEVLHGVSLSAREGSLVALVGESGSGKSTLAKLLVHFYDVSGGSVKIGGQDVRDMSIESLNDQISYVSQEQFLFNMSLLENIRLGKLDATDEEVLSAAEKAQCGEFLARLPHGIHTMAGDGGKQLSGGERQRISLARAILKNAPIVVLDEATAFADPDNEAKVQAAFSVLAKGKTVLMIAHRLSTVTGADRIVVIKDGKIEDTGTHGQLKDKDGLYAEMWKQYNKAAKWKVGVSNA